MNDGPELFDWADYERQISHPNRARRQFTYWPRRVVRVFFFGWS